MNRNRMTANGHGNESAVSPREAVAVSGTLVMKLTDRTVEAARCPDGRKDVLIFDDALKGFGLRVRGHYTICSKSYAKTPGHRPMEVARRCGKAHPRGQYLRRHMARID